MIYFIYKPLKEKILMQEFSIKFQLQAFQESILLFGGLCCFWGMLLMF